tara:strand:+ start:66097 stop:66864 length:768 start_codon:yes stop_codon:yes gene_type:complete
MGNERPLALVTGGHRRLGGYISAHLAHAGYALAIHGSHDVALAPELEGALHESGAQWGGFVADFEQPASACEMMQAVVAHFGRAPDLLVNSAALFGQDRLEDVSESDLMRHYAVNCAAPVLLTQAFAKASEGSGHNRSIINILDQRLANPHGDQLGYTLAKQALAGFTRIAARELAGHGIRVNAVAPGLTIATDDYDAAHMARLARLMPLGRLPEAEEIAAAVLYLAQARSVTAQVIAVDGGAHMQSHPRDFMHM